MTDEWGVDASYLDDLDQKQVVSAESVHALREIIGRRTPGSQRRTPLVTRPGRSDRLAEDAAEIAFEDGSARPVRGQLPADLPLGYHTLVSGDGSSRGLIVSPGRCHLPPDWRAWGWAVQLYAARSRRSWGIGDLADLRLLTQWSAARGAGFLLVTPLHASAPTLPQEPSPYLPTSRRFRNPLYLRPEDIPGAERVGPALAAAIRAGRRLDEQRLIDRDEVWRLKRPALQAIFDLDGGGEQFHQWRERRGESLQEFATWCALAEVHGADWREWPQRYRRPTAEAVRHFAREAVVQVDFHAWLQFAVERQLGAATAGLPAIQDLPIGFDPGGADAWSWQDLLAEGVTVGAPPDAFIRSGQEWGLPPFVPWRLQEAAYQPFIESIRATIAQAGGLRIDHVMGLFRLWWIPSGWSPAQGGYVRYPSEDLLDILALESHRAAAPVVGEDLGTVEAGVREAMAAHDMLSYRLLWFEDEDPSTWPVEAMAAVSTHDLPTVTGLWTGVDLAEQRRYGVVGGDDDPTAVLRAKVTGVPATAAPEQATEAAYRLLARAPSRLLTATLDDAVGEPRRPNMPGASDRPNWSLALPMRLEDLIDHPGPAAVAAILGADRT